MRVTVSRVSRARSSGSGSAPSARNARSTFPSAVACSGRCEPTSRIWSVLSGPEHVMDHQHAVAVQSTDPHRLAGTDGEIVCPGECATAQLVDVEVDVAQLQQRGAELILAALGILLDEALRLERASAGRAPCPWRGRAGRSAPTRQAGASRPQSARRIAAARSIDWIATLLRRLRPCRTVFDNVECSHVGRRRARDCIGVALRGARGGAGRPRPTGRGESVSILPAGGGPEGRSAPMEPCVASAIRRGRQR